MTLTHKQALFAAFTLLDDLYDQTKNEQLRELLSDMNPFIFTDRTSADQATWIEWVNCAIAMQDDGKLTDEAIFETLVSFLHHNKGEYGYDLDLILREIQSPLFQNRWEQLLEKVYAYTDV